MNLLRTDYSNEKIDYLEEFSGPLMPIRIAEEERIRREHGEYIVLMERLITINPYPHPTVNANTIVESLDIVTNTDELLPPGFENDDSEGEIDVVEELHVDNSISNSENELSDNEASDFDNLSFPRPPPKPPDAEFDVKTDAGEEISVMMNDELECLDPRDEIDVFTNDEDDDYFPFMFVIRIFLLNLIHSEVFPFILSAESEDTIFDPGMVGTMVVPTNDSWHAIPKNMMEKSSFVNKALTWWNTQVKARGREAAIVLRAGILTDEAVSCGTLTKGNEKRKGVKESSKQGGERNDDKRAKVAPINVVRGGYEPGTCYDLAPGQVGNQLTIEENRNSRNNGNQVKGGAFNVNAVGALQDPNVVTGTFSLHHHYATVLFDSRANFSFISTSFAPLLNVKSSFVNPGYLIEVADDKKVEVDRVIRNCKLELGTSLFTIDLIPLGHGSFDVIVGMDWLSKHKAEIVCHEKGGNPCAYPSSIGRLRSNEENDLDLHLWI
nr:putative reverse transcriptase domain-containing protein [Tanacetum cinerariifolium]